jgi:hypothetical protein
MSCGCASPAGGRTIKPIVRGDSWAYYWNLSNGCPAQPIGDNTWAAQFVLTDPRNVQNVLYTASTLNGGVFWSAPGVANVVIPQATTAAFTFCAANFRLDLSAPSALDPNGFKQTYVQGFVNVPMAGELPRDDFALRPGCNPCGAWSGANIDRSTWPGYPFFPWTPACGNF